MWICQRPLGAERLSEQGWSGPELDLGLGPGGICRSEEGGEPQEAQGVWGVWVWGTGPVSTDTSLENLV